jgi:hypothetical protein
MRLLTRKQAPKALRRASSWTAAGLLQCGGAVGGNGIKPCNGRAGVRMQRAVPFRGPASRRRARLGPPACIIRACCAGRRVSRKLPTELNSRRAGEQERSLAASRNRGRARRAHESVGHAQGGKRVAIPPSHAPARACPRLRPGVLRRRRSTAWADARASLSSRLLRRLQDRAGVAHGRRSGMLYRIGRLKR